jgi:alcohol dehydrogenase
VEVARAANPDLLVALGGGSSIDAAKGCNFLLTNGGRMQDYWGHGKASKPMLPLVVIPTTAGTRSDMQAYALISDAKTHRKMACGDRKALARVALLDPALAVSQPHLVIACSGLDTIAHAVETAVTTRRNPVSRMFSRESFRLARAAFPRVLADANDLEAQGDMMLAAAFGGLAIENSMLGAAHSMSNPLTADFDVVHGHAVGLVLPRIVRFNADLPEARAEYAALAAAAGLANGTTRSTEPVEALLACIESLYAATGLPDSLDACGVDRAAIASLAEGAASQWTAQFNPRAVTASDFEMLYAEAFREPA